MSKLLKAVLRKHRPHIVAKMTKENGYDETKHLHAKDLHKAGIISKSDLDDVENCLDDLAAGHHNGVNALRAAASGELSKDKLNDDAFIKTIMALDSDTGGDGDSVDADSDDDGPIGDDELADDGDPLADNGKVTA